MYSLQSGALVQPIPFSVSVNWHLHPAVTSCDYKRHLVTNKKVFASDTISINHLNNNNTNFKDGTLVHLKLVDQM